MVNNNQDFKNIDIQKFKKIINIILDRMTDKLDVHNVLVDDLEDFYWDVPKDSIFKVKEKQPELLVGRMSDDWMFLQSILEDEENGVSLMLIHVAPLLRMIGEKIGQ